MAKHNFIDITGQKFNMLTVLKYYGKNKNRESLWECVCDCGNKTTLSGSSIRLGRTKSCGCFSAKSVAIRNTKHSMARNGNRVRLYGVWDGIKSRCLNANSKQYKDYGGRGITICEEWMEFVPFRKWALENGYKDNLFIDRINNDKGYSPDNCRFVTRSQNQRNMRSNRRLTINGVTRLVVEWCELTGIDRRTLTMRAERGWEDALMLSPPSGASYEYRRERKQNGG